jgi:hypothetical protein
MARGRKLKGDKAMSNAERQALWRQRAKAAEPAGRVPGLAAKIVRTICPQAPDRSARGHYARTREKNRAELEQILALARKR